MTNETAYKIGNWTFTPSRNELADGDTTLRLEDRAGRVLEYLCQNAGSVVSKEQLIEHVWQGRHLSEQSVPVVISYLRKTFSEGGGQTRVIETIPKRGYRIIEAGRITLKPEKARQPNTWLLAAAVAAAVVFLGLYLLQGEQSEARKPGIILTLNDIRNATGNDDLMPQVIAMSEAGSYYLSKADEVLLIRHWWNIDADDPTGGIFERYGEDAPVYHVTGTLIEEGGDLTVTLFLNDPRTDEVLWSEASAISEDDFLTPHLANLGKILAVLGAREQIAPPGPGAASGEAVTEYWLGLYLWHLGTEDAAEAAAARWQNALLLDPAMSAAEAGLKALWARWPALSPGADVPLILDGKETDPALLVGAGIIALYRDNDPAKAEQMARKALLYSPNDHAAYALLAESLVLEGKIEEGLKAIREAQLLAPFSSVYPEREAIFAEMLNGED